MQEIKHNAETEATNRSETMTGHHFTSRTFDAFEDTRIGEFDEGYWGPGHYFYADEDIDQGFDAEDMRGWTHRAVCDIPNASQLLDLSQGDVVTDELATILGNEYALEAGDDIIAGDFEGDRRFVELIKGAGYKGVYAWNQICVFDAVDVTVVYWTEIDD